MFVLLVFGRVGRSPTTPFLVPAITRVIQAVCFFYEHASFTPVPYGDVIPSFDVEIAGVGEQ